jgi:hypothetical protein
MTVYNSTSYQEEDIKKQKIIGYMKNHWRQRDVIVYDGGESMVFTIGISFDKTQKIITYENKSIWENTIKIYPRIFEFH